MGAHILYGAVKPSIATSDDGYYEVAAQAGKFCNTRAHRTDITAVIGKDAGHGAPACFIPSLAEMHLNTEVVSIGNPDKVDLSDKMWLLSHAPAVGALTHEAAHARHTHWDPRDLMDEHGATRKMLDVITTLEEPRIEAQAVRLHPDSRPYLRGCAMEIVGRDFKIGDTKYGAAAAAGLLLARVDAKVLTRAETRGFRADIRKVLGDTLDALEPLWQRFLRLHDHDYDGMVEVAAAWLEALGEDPEDSEGMVGESMMGEPMPGEGSGSGEGGEGGEGDGDGEGSESEAPGFGGKIMKRVHITESKIDRETVEARGDERAERARAEREQDAARRKEAEGPHTEAFGVPGGPHGFSLDGASHYSHSRPPSADERRAAKMLASALEKIDYRDRAVTKTVSIVPPGRLRGRAAVQADAYTAAGRDASEVAMWQGKRRRKVESTPLTIGFLGDISGSMGSAMEPLASCQWVVSTAGNHIDAQVATVHFGEGIHGIAPAGVREKEVRLFGAYDGTEDFKDAALAIDRELNLLDGSGARLLFVASDGHYVDTRHMIYSQTFNRLAQRKGVAVIYLNFTGTRGGAMSGASAVIDCQHKSPAEVAQIVGRTAIAEMRRIDSRV
jgi:hypothetical protein